MDNLQHLHKLYGIKKARINYQGKDFVDYTLMTLISAFIIVVAYGRDNILSIAGVGLCAYMVVAFLVRHGFVFGVPVILRRPQDILYMVIYKIQNIKLVYLLALSFLLLENYLVYVTPDFPHNVEFMHKMAIYVFYLHFLSITIYRTVILFAHIGKRMHVREVLMQSSWKNVLIRSNVTLEIIHAYFTGMLTHIVLIAPWYVVISYANYSVIFLPVICIINVVIHFNFYKVINAWFYRDHWLGHNSELEFLYLHGTHHDAIPSGLIGVAGNGHLEGFLRHIIGYPNPFYNPIVAFLTYTIEVKKDIETHQYIPGIYPEIPRDFQQISQHSTHHFGRLEPYGFAVKLDQPNVSSKLKEEFRRAPEELKNSANLDEQLGFEWNNNRHKWYLDLVDKYRK